MNNLIMIGIILGLIVYTIEIIMNPEKHMISLIILAIFYAIFGSFFDSTGAKSDYDRKKKG